jgi:hypothetical protein
MIISAVKVDAVALFQNIFFALKHNFKRPFKNKTPDTDTNTRVLPLLFSDLQSPKISRLFYAQNPPPNLDIYTLFFFLLQSLYLSLQPLSV